MRKVGEAEYNHASFKGVFLKTLPLSNGYFYKEYFSKPCLFQKNTFFKEIRFKYCLFQKNTFETLPLFKEYV